MRPCGSVLHYPSLRSNVDPNSLAVTTILHIRALKGRDLSIILMNPLPSQSSDAARFVIASRNVGAIDSNRSRSICSIPRAIVTFHTRTSPPSDFSL